jgi:hypothetical protein
VPCPTAPVDTSNIAAAISHSSGACQQPPPTTGPMTADRRAHIHRLIAIRDAVDRARDRSTDSRQREPVDAFSTKLLRSVRASGGPQALGRRGSRHGVAAFLYCLDEFSRQHAFRAATENLRLVERFTRPEVRDIDHQFTATDPEPRGRHFWTAASLDNRRRFA